MTTRFLVSLLAILGALFPLLLSLPQPQPAQAVGSISAAATATRTPRPSPTATSTPCAVVPNAPGLASPADGVKIKVNPAVLKWYPATCAKTYRLIIRRDSPTGQIIANIKGLSRTAYKRTFGAGRTYFWSVGACDPIGCTYSGYWSFKEAVPPAPPPPPPAGTPVPGITPIPPLNIVNYQGPAVYLNNLPNALYYADCNSKWWGMGSTIYFEVVGFRPNDQVNVSYQILGIQDTTYYTTLTADGNGNVQMAWNSTGKTLGHYHWWFTSPSASYCGHFDHNP